MLEGATLETPDGKQLTPVAGESTRATWIVQGDRRQGIQAAGCPYRRQGKNSVRPDEALRHLPCDAGARRGDDAMRASAADGPPYAQKRTSGLAFSRSALCQTPEVAQLQPSLLGAAGLLKLKLVSAASVRDRRFSFSKI